jgi:Gram-negative porin
MVRPPERWRVSRRKKEDGMRKFLLASVATLGTGGLIGTAMAQAPAGAPTQGQVAYPAANPTAYVNNNNNYQAAALPGALANPTPGTMVVHINGKVQTEMQANWSSVDTRTITVGGVTGTVKVEPLAMQYFARIYAGMDAMATNGLRYGAAMEIRQNFTGAISSTSSTNASGLSCAQTLYVRRAFMYLAGENWGLFRFGQADGVIGIFDNGVTTGGFSIIGELGGGDAQNSPGATPPFWFLSTQGAEYAYQKAVYISPQFAGFDFGFQYAPQVTGNGFGLSTGNPANALFTSGTGIGCGSGASSGCPTLSSGFTNLDGSRILNQYVAGVRYQGTFSGLGLLAYAAYEGSGHSNYTGPQTAAALGTTTVVTAPGASRYSGKYNGLSFGSGGVALTYSGFTVSGNIIGGRVNNQGALQPEGGSDELAYILGAKYVTGPWTFGVQAEIGWMQGSVELTGVSQRRGRGIAVGTQYTIAPGLQVAAEYVWNDNHQQFNNFGATGTINVGNSAAAIAGGSTRNNTFTSQAFTVGTVVNF